MTQGIGVITQDYALLAEFAFTEIKTENDQDRNFQSSQMKILSLPGTRR